MADIQNTDSNVVDNTKIVNINKTIDKEDPNLQLLQPTWMNVWKEFLAYIFGAIIAFDFIIAPSIVMFLDAYAKAGLPPWTPLTLQGAGTFYVAMGAILSVGAYGSFVKSRELIKNLPDMSNCEPPH